MTTITIALEDELVEILQMALHRQAISTEELVKRALYHYLDEAQMPAQEVGEDSLVGLFDLGDPFLSEQSEEILQSLFSQTTAVVAP